MDNRIAGLLAEAQRRHVAGDLAGAAALYTQAMRFDQGNPDLLNGFGLLLRDLGRMDDAATCFTAAIAGAPGLADAYDNLGSLKAAQGKWAEAEALHRAALARRGDFVAAWNNLGNAVNAQGRAEEAFAVWRLAVLLDPGRAEALSNLGGALRERDRFPEAEAWHLRALRRLPGQAAPINNLGDALLAQRRIREAEACFRRAVALVPGFPEAWCNLALAAQRTGWTERADALFGRALVLCPDLAMARFNRGLLRLERGDLAGGWPGYGWRFAAGRTTPSPAIPPWRGEPLAGTRLLIRGEQGVGDTILFASLCGEAVERARSVVIEVDRRLVSLFARSFPRATVRPAGGDGRDCDRHVPMGSLARVFRTALGDFPADRAGWLVPDPERAALWRERLAALGPGLTVGIAWRSGLMTAERRAAYTELKQWGPLFALPGVRFVTLQYGDCADEIAEAETRFGVRLHRWPDLDLTDDFEGTAGLIANLDLVLSPAVSVGELAGALGVAVWRFGGRDWTQLGTGVRPWFPAMRPVPPPPGGDPADGLARIVRHLERLRSCAPLYNLRFD